MHTLICMCAETPLPEDMQESCHIYSEPQHTATHCNTLQHTATHCHTLQHTATHCNTLQHTAIHCNTLQHTATHGNTPQHTATHCNTICGLMIISSQICWRLIPAFYSAIVCRQKHSVLQCTGLQGVAVCESSIPAFHFANVHTQKNRREKERNKVLSSKSPYLMTKSYITNTDMGWLWLLGSLKS